jgi:putative membrane protein
MGVQFLDEAAAADFGAAIETIELASAVEVVVAVRKRSSSYHHANAIVGFAVATALLAFALYAETLYALDAILLAPLVFGIVAALATELSPALKRVLTPRAHRHARVLRAARATFVERGVHNTSGRSGVLAYVALLEREVVLVPDSGIAAKLPAEAFARVSAAMTDAFGKGGSAVAAALKELAPHCARAMPHTDADVNELPDVVDSDEKRARA